MEDIEPPGGADKDDKFVEVKLAKKVLAPFLRTLKKKRAVHAEVVHEEFREFYLQRNPTEVLSKLTSFFTDDLGLTTVLNETAEVLKCVTRSRGVNLYLTDYRQNIITQCPKYIQNCNRDLATFKIEPRTTLAAYVAYFKEYVMEDDMLGDIRFPDGIPGLSRTVKSVLCVPVMTSAEGSCIAVIELYRNYEEGVYSSVDLQICVAVTGWMGIAIHQNNERLSMLKKMEIHEYLRSITQLYFDGALTFDKIIADFIKFAKAAVKAEKGSFFLMDDPVAPNTDQEIFASAFEEGTADGEATVIIKKKLKRRFVQGEPGVAGYCARSGKIVNIQDAYLDQRFDQTREVFNFRTQALISVPIKNSRGVVGVLLLANKSSNSHFVAEDEEILMTFSNYAALSCNYAASTNALKKANHMLAIQSDFLLLHVMPSSEELNNFKTLPVLNEQQMPPGFFGFDWYVGSYEDEAAKYALHMMLGSNLIEESLFEFSTMADFVLTVKRAYRAVPYHNFEHAFTVCHCMFNIVKRNKDKFSPIEIVSLLIASLCHDVDHKGYTNSFLELTNSPIAGLYGDSPLEHHHYQVCMMIISATDVLSNFPAEEFSAISEEIKHLILATDLSYFFQTKIWLVKLMNEGTFDWSDTKHRELFKCVVMTCCDVSGQLKPFDIAKRISENLYKEFYRQGDLEKKMNLVPLSNMDRDQMSLVPDNHICFMNIVCIPCVDIIVSIFPNVGQLSILCREVLERWKGMLLLRGVEIWKPDESTPKEKRQKSRVGALTSTYSSIKSIYSDSRSVDI